MKPSLILSEACKHLIQKNIEPLYSPLEQKAFKHEDIENSDNKKDEFLKNAAASNDDYFLVPRVVE